MSKDKKKSNNVTEARTVRTHEEEMKIEDNQESQIEYGWKTLERIDSWTSSCDSKISMLLGIWGVMITVFITSDSVQAFNDFIKERINNVTNQNDAESIIWLLAIVAAVVLFVKCIYHIVGASLARIDEDKYKQEKLKTNSSLFFGAVSKKAFKDYYKGFVNENEEEQLRDIISQVYINSCIANKKHLEYNKSLKWFLFTSGYVFLLVVIASIFF